MSALLTGDAPVVLETEQDIRAISEEVTRLSEHTEESLRLVRKVCNDPARFTQAEALRTALLAGEEGPDDSTLVTEAKSVEADITTALDEAREASEATMAAIYRLSTVEESDRTRDLAPDSLILWNMRLSVAVETAEEALDLAWKTRRKARAIQAFLGRGERRGTAHEVAVLSTVLDNPPTFGSC